jgi:hypothetical protein
MTLPTLPVSGVVNVQVVLAPRAAPLRNFGAMLILGDSDVIDTDQRIRTYAASELGDIAAAFGSTAPEYLAALAFFSQNPQPRSVQIGRWAKVATNGQLKGKILSTEQQAISRFTGVTDGAFDVAVDGTTVSVTGVDLSAVTNLNGIATVITTALNGSATCVWTGERFVLKSASAGASSTVANATSTTLTQLMGLDEGTTGVAGIDAESLADCVNIMIDRPTWYGMYLAVAASDDDKKAVAAIIEAAAPAHIFAYTTADTAVLEPGNSTTLEYALKAAGYQRTVWMLSTHDAHAAMSLLGRIATVNFSGSNTTITLKFKQCPGVSPENLTVQQAAALAAVNGNAFVAYDNDTAILQEGTMAGGWFVDERHGLDWLQNYVETAVWNLLYTSTTKVGQDEEGSNALVAEVCRAMDQSVRNNLVSPGVWNSDGFGALKRGDTLTSGYYVYIQPLAEQSQADREARKAPPIQVAAKLTGAVHFVDVTISVNR